MKSKAIIPLVLGLGVGLVAVKFLMDTVKKAQGSNAQQTLVTAVRAKMDIEAFQEITPDLVELIETAASPLLPAGDRIAKLEDALGRVSSKAIPKQSPVLQSMLAPKGTPAGMFGRIPSGYRAVSVKIDEASAVAYQLKPGDWVDVVVVMDLDTGNRGRKKQTIAEVILQHVQVGAVGQITGAATGSADSRVKPAKSVTLIVAEEDVPKLHLAGTRGKITLAMRGADDQVSDRPLVADSDQVFKFLNEDPIEEPQPTTIASFTSEPAPPIEMPHGVTVFYGAPRGLKVEQTTFSHKDSRMILDQGEGRGSRTSALLNRPGRSSGAPARPAVPVPPLPTPEANPQDEYTGPGEENGVENENE